MVVAQGLALRMTVSVSGMARVGTFLLMPAWANKCANNGLSAIGRGRSQPKLCEKPLKFTAFPDVGWVPFLREG